MAQNNWQGERLLTESELRMAITEAATNDEEFRAKLLDNPAEAVEEAFDIELPSGLTFQVHEETRDSFHLVLPPSAQLTQEELAAVSGGNWSSGS